jgi:hypothetical protein
MTSQIPLAFFCQKCYKQIGKVWIAGPGNFLDYHYFIDGTQIVQLKSFDKGNNNLIFLISLGWSHREQFWVP